VALREKAVTHGEPQYICCEFESWVFVRAPVALKRCEDSSALVAGPTAGGLLLPSSLPRIGAAVLWRLAGLRCSVFLTGEKRDL